MRLSVALLCHALATRQVLSFSISLPHLARGATVLPLAPSNETNTTRVEIWAQGTKWPYKYVNALPLNASVAARKFQPLVDFDDHTCYNMPAIDPDGNLNAGFRAYYIEDVRVCRQTWGLEPKNTNVYVRRRCNNGWCAWMYGYYFPMDQVYGPLAEIHGQRHEWDHIVVWTRHPFLETDAGYVKNQGISTPNLIDLTPDHKYYKTVEGRTAAFLNSTEHRLEDYETRMIGGKEGLFSAGKDIRIFEEHAKVIYGWTGFGKLKHSFREATAADTVAQNELRHWIQGGLVEWEGMPRELREKMLKNDWGKARMEMADENFENILRAWSTDDIERGFDYTKDYYPHIPQFENSNMAGF